MERKRPLTSAEKRKRNETLAIGISRAELLKPEASDVSPNKSEEERNKVWDQEEARQVDKEKTEAEEAERVAKEVMARLAEEKARASVEEERKKVDANLA